MVFYVNSVRSHTSWGTDTPDCVWFALDEGASTREGVVGCGNRGIFPVTTLSQLIRLDQDLTTVADR